MAGGERLGNALLTASVQNDSGGLWTADQPQPHAEPLDQTETGRSPAMPHTYKADTPAPRSTRARAGTTTSGTSGNVAVCSRLVVLKAETLHRLWEQSVKEEIIAGLDF